MTWLLGTMGNLYQRASPAWVRTPVAPLVVSRAALGQDVFSATAAGSV